MGADFVLHPLIHTSPSENLSHHVVASPQEEKCGLKYVIHSPAKVVECCGENLETSTVFVHSIKYAGNTKRFLSITDCRLELLELSAWDKSLLQVQDH